MITENVDGLRGDPDCSYEAFWWDMLVRMRRSSRTLFKHLMWRCRHGATCTRSDPKVGREMDLALMRAGVAAPYQPIPPTVQRLVWKLNYGNSDDIQLDAEP